MAELELPNGTIVEYPDDADVQSVVAGLKKSMPAAFGESRGLGAAFKFGAQGLGQSGLALAGAAPGAVAAIERGKTYVPSEDLQEVSRLIDEEGAWGKALVKTLLNPIDVIGEVIAGSLPNMAANVAGAVAGLPAGPAGVVAGAGLASTATETGRTILEQLEKSGVNLNDAAQVEAAFNDPELMAKARVDGLKRGVPVGVFDAVSFGLAGKVRQLAGAATRGRKAAGWAGEAGLQAGAGMAGEAGGQLALEGEVTSPSAVFLEGIAELPGAVVEPLVTRPQAPQAPSATGVPTTPAQPVGPVVRVNDEVSIPESTIASLFDENGEFKQGFPSSEVEPETGTLQGVPEQDYGLADIPNDLQDVFGRLGQMFDERGEMVFPEVPRTVPETVEQAKDAQEGVRPTEELIEQRTYPEEQGEPIGFERIRGDVTGPSQRVDLAAAPGVRPEFLAEKEIKPERVQVSQLEPNVFEVRLDGEFLGWVNDPRKAEMVLQDKVQFDEVVKEFDIKPETLTAADKDFLKGTIRRLAGPNINVYFDNAARLGRAVQQINAKAGYWRPANQAINGFRFGQLIALNNSVEKGDGVNTAVHESWHAIQGLLPDNIRKILDDAYDKGELDSFIRPENRDWRKTYEPGQYRSEAESWAVGDYAQGLFEQGKFPGVSSRTRGALKKAWEFIKGLLPDVRKYLKGKPELQEPTTVKEVFDRFIEGEYNNLLPPLKSLDDFGVVTDKANADTIDAFYGPQGKMALPAIPKDVHIEDTRQLSWWDSWVKHLTFIGNKYPLLRPFVETVFDTKRKAQVLLTDMLSMQEPFMDLTTTERANVERAAMADDARGEVTEGLTYQDEQGTFSLSEKERAVLEKLRDSFEYARGQFDKSVRAALGLGDMPLEEMAKRDEPIYQNGAALLRDLQNLGRSYMPRIRFGDMFISVYEYDKNEDGSVKKGKDGKPIKRTVHYEKFYKSPLWSLTNKEAAKIRDRLQKQYPGAEVSMARPANQEEFARFAAEDLGMLEGLINSFGFAKPKDVAEFLEKFKEKVEIRGFKERLTRRKGIPGYYPPEWRGRYMTEALKQYNVGFSNYAANLENQPKMQDAVKGVAESGDERAVEWVRKQLDYTRSPQEESGWAKAIAFHGLIGFRLSSALVNLTQTVHTTAPLMSMLWGTKALPVIAKNFGNAFKLVQTNLGAKALRDEGLDLSKAAKYYGPEKARLLEELQREGIIDPMNAQDIMGSMSPRFTKIFGQRVASGMDNYLRASALMFAFAERVNRITVALSAYDLAKQGVPDTVRGYVENSRHKGQELTPKNLARMMIEDTQFIISKQNRPLIMQGTIQQIATQFMSFPLQMLEMYASILNNAGLQTREKVAGLGMMALGVWATAGLLGFPFVEPAKELVDWLREKLTGKKGETEYEIRRFLATAMGLSPTMIDVLLKGPASQAGVDIASRTGLEIIRPQIAGQSAIEVLGGPFVGLALSSGKLAADAFNDGRYHEMFLAAAPLAIRDMVEAIKAKEQGFRSQKGEVLMRSDEVGPGDVAARALGFTPTQLANRREAVGMLRDIDERDRALRERYSKKLGKALEERDQKKVQEIVQEVVEYNRKQPIGDRINLRTLMKNARNRALDARQKFAGPQDLKDVTKARRSEAKEIGNVISLD